ncbi:hypothetical protein M408DRAFT_329777 [Serendipita vermifera MAFF 305830]|uniref:Uncharacterized protein n=1 Tax=Serendipita vermifera MAFF 305830 TaxID=933852 RepID=A0A0C3B6S2_SERVB|nr:hypothetical protein M408DRAFT_329777 [Serendipita vermifera MAFF 305830]
MFITLSSALLFLYPILTNAANDWSVACVGSCSYETGDGVNTAWGSILLDGSPEVVSDLSDAAGWSIMDCDDKSTEAQDVRIVCHNPDAGCERLFEGGADNTIVRLPEECAGAPFARVINVTSSTNQTLTRKVSKLMAASSRRRSTPPEVLTITIDYNFHLIPESRGTVSLTALATTNPLQRPMADAQVLRRALGYSESGELNARSANSPSELVKREALRRDLFASFVGGNVIPEGTTFAPGNATSKRGHGNGHEARWLDWEKDWNHQFDVLDIQQAFPVVDAGLSCPQNGDVPAFDAKIKIDADVKARATVSIGFIVAGSVLPPAITKAAFTSALDGGVEAAFKINAVAQGSFNTGLLPLYTSGLAGMSIPGILDIGPTFSINGQGIGSISVCTDAVVTANYQFPGLSMVYPQDEGASTGQASQGSGDNPLVLSIGGSAELKGKVSAHLIPRVDLGVSVLSGLASASVFLQLDGYGELNMGLTVQGGASTTVTPSSTIRAIEAVTSAESESLTSAPVSTETSTSTSSSTSDVPTSSDSTSSSVSEEAITTSTAEKSTTTTTDAFIPDDQVQPPAEEPSDSPETPAKEYVKASEEPASSPATTTTLAPAPTPSNCPSRRNRRRQLQAAQKRDVIITHEGRDVSGSYGGCVGVNLGVKIVAGAQGKLLSFWKDSVTYDIFAKDWEIFNKCFQGSMKRDLPPFRHGPIVPSMKSPAALLDLKKRQLDGLICPAISDSLSASHQIV